MAVEKILKALIPELKKHLIQVNEGGDVNYCELQIKIHNGSIYTEISKKSKIKY